jgi:hypothetical protein
MGVLPMLPKLSSSFQVRGKLIMAIAFFWWEWWKKGEGVGGGGGCESDPNYMPEEMCWPSLPAGWRLTSLPLNLTEFNHWTCQFYHYTSILSNEYVNWVITSTSGVMTPKHWTPLVYFEPPAY